MKTSKRRTWYIYITLLLAKAHLGEVKTHSVEAQRGVTAKYTQNNSTIPIYRYDVTNLSLETPTLLNRHHIRIIQAYNQQNQILYGHQNKSGVI